MRRGWRTEKCAARRGRRERRGSAESNDILAEQSHGSKLSASSKRSTRRKIVVYRRRPFADGERSNDNSLHINVFVPAERYLYNRNGCWDK